jgi:glycosyltransferase involved in cell wall biosynthesis
MRICYVLPTAGIAGGVNIIIEHATRLIQRGHEVFFLQCDSHQNLSWYPGNIVSSYSIHQEDSIRFYCSQPVDLLVATGWQTVYEILRRKLPARSYVYFFQADEKNFYPQDSTEHDLAAFTPTLPFHYYTEANWICNLLQTHYGHSVFYARHGINREIFYSAEPLMPKPDHKLRVLLEGPLSQPRKRMDDAFLAVEGLDVEVWLVTSDGELQPWQKPDQIFRKVPITMMKQIYSACDVLIKLPTVEGVFGPPLEMMACGGTCITSNVLGHEEYVVDGHNALVVPMGDFRAARSALQTLMQEPQLLQTLKLNGLKTAEAFPWKPTIDQLEQHFQNLITADRNRTTALDTCTVDQYFRLEPASQIALRLCLRRYFEITWNMGSVDAVFNSDRILDASQVVPAPVPSLSLVCAQGWAFDSSSGEVYQSIDLIAKGRPIEATLNRVTRSDLVSIDPRALNAGYALTAMVDQSFSAQLEITANYSTESCCLNLLSTGELTYGCIDQLAILSCYQIDIHPRLLNYSEGFCVCLDLDQHPDQIYLGFSQDKFWQTAFSVHESPLGKRIQIDDFRLFSDVLLSGQTTFLIWLPENVQCRLITVEPSVGQTVI